MGRDAVLAGGSRDPAPERSPGQTSKRTTDWVPDVRSPRNAKADRYRDGASKDADASVFDASDPALPGRPASSGPFRRNPEHAPFGAPSPSTGGRKEMGIRANPRAQPTTGADLLWLLNMSTAGQSTPFVPAEAGTQGSHVLMGRLGPRLHGDERGEISARCKAVGAPSPAPERCLHAAVAKSGRP